MCDIVTRARRTVGTPFRLHGRDVQGLDCIGLVAIAWGVPDVPTGYAMRGGTLARVDDRLHAAGGVRKEKGEAGDVVAAMPGPAQIHLMILTADGFIHADAGLRRVVEVPGAVPWPILATWRKGAN